jgi:hypothetical protein
LSFPGERFVFRRRLVVAPRSDVAAATDLAFPMLGFADGSSGSPDPWRQRACAA